MKRGCLSKSIFIVVIIAASLYYLIVNYGADIFDYGKEKLVNSAIEKLYGNLDELKNDQNYDHLKNIVNEYFAKIDFSDIDKAFENVKIFIQSVDKIIDDKVIESSELEQLKTILSKE